VTRSPTALLVIDVQQGALDGCVDAAEVIERINDLSARAAEAGTAVIFIQHAGADDGLHYGSQRWQLAEGVVRPDGSFLVEKTYRDAFAETELERLLARLAVERLVLTGLHSDYCVQMTALSALLRGYDIVLVSDGHTTFDSSEHPSLSGEAITALVNARMAMLRHPEREIEVLPAAEVAFRHS
jgi:nicotinamidase-related amidase